MTHKWRLLLVSLGVAATLSAGTQPVENSALQKAIVRGDNAAVQKLLEQGAKADDVDAAGNPALLNAVVFGNTAMVKTLLNRGASVNAKNPMGATALLWGAGDPEKAKLLVAAGADVNAASATGRTPLHVAATVAGNSATVKLLLEHGAKVDVKDKLDSIPVVFVGGGKGTPLLEAARSGDLASVKLLVAAGADINSRDSHDATPLTEAVVTGRKDIVRFLLDHNAAADVNVTPLQFPILALAAIRGDENVALMLIKAGADVNARTVKGETPLMFAAYSDNDNISFVEALLQTGADAKAVSKAGESALDWALQRGETRTVRALRLAGSPSRPVAQAGPAPEFAPKDMPLAKTFELMRAASDAGIKKTGCASCHNHMLPLQAAGMATARGIEVDAKTKEGMANYMFAFIKPAVPVMLESSSVLPEMGLTSGYILDSLAANQYPADTLTAAIVHAVLMQQSADGRWVGAIPRPPMMTGDIQATAYAIRALKLYPLAGRQQEIDRRVAHAAQWLRRATPNNTEDTIMRVLGLKWAGVSSQETAAAAQQLQSMQRNDGGWGQLPALASDAYATGKALYALRAALGAKADQAALANGARFLRNVRRADGSWQTTARAYPFQPLVDTAFPHGRDQWISVGASSWAVMGLIAAESQQVSMK